MVWFLHLKRPCDFFRLKRLKRVETYPHTRCRVHQFFCSLYDKMSERIFCVKITLSGHQPVDTFWLDETSIFFLVTMVNNIVFDLMTQCIRAKQTRNIVFELDVQYDNVGIRTGLNKFHLSGDLEDWSEEIFRWFYDEYSMNNLIVHCFEVSVLQKPQGEDEKF